VTAPEVAKANRMREAPNSALGWDSGLGVGHCFGPSLKRIQSLQQPTLELFFFVFTTVSATVACFYLDGMRAVQRAAIRRCLQCRIECKRRCCGCVVRSGRDETAILWSVFKVHRKPIVPLLWR